MGFSWDPGTLLLPAGARLVHIGPPKTGTTMLQTAFHNGRAAIAPQGVRFAGTDRHPMKAILAAAGRPGPIGGVPPSIENWQALARDIGRAGEDRVLLSSEFLAEARPDAIARIVEDLGADRIHVAVTLRPLASILPSQWQQYIQSGVRASYDRWLDAMFNQPTTKLTPSFWFRHRHDRLVERWSEVVGPDNVTVVILDDRDHAMVLRVFERLLGLDEDTLSADDDRTNRSMTWPEIEAVRAFNALFRAEGLDTALHTMVMRFGAAAYMKTRTPEPGEPRIVTPAWALERAETVAREMANTLAASGVRIVGDLTALTRTPSKGAGDLPPVEISPTVAASAAMGILIASGLARGATPQGQADRPPDEIVRAGNTYEPRTTTEPFDLLRVSTPRLTKVLVRRLRASARNRVRTVRARIR